MPLLLSMDHTALSMALPLNAPSSFIMPLPSPSDSYFVLPGYQTQIPSCLCAFVYAVPSPRLPFPTFFAKTPPTHSLWLCVDTASSSNCSLVTPGGPFCTWGHPPPSMLAFASPCWNRPRLCLLCFAQGEVITCYQWLRVICHPVQRAYKWWLQRVVTSWAVMGALTSSNKLS